MVQYSACAHTIITVSQSECEAATNWLCNNKMIVNLDKFN